MQIHYDKEADALYIALGKDSGQRGVVSHTERVPGKPIAVDYDADGRIFGIEIFDLSACSYTGFSEDFLLQYVGEIAPQRVESP